MGPTYPTQMSKVRLGVGEGPPQGHTVQKLKRGLWTQICSAPTFDPAVLVRPSWAPLHCRQVSGPLAIE
jgi:hypothetical protein